VDTASLTAHADALKAEHAHLASAVQAAEYVNQIDQLAFGVLCSPLGMIASPVMGHFSGNLSDATDALQATSEMVHAFASGYEEVENGLVQTFNKMTASVPGT
jgi:hypothetical protein